MNYSVEYPWTWLYPDSEGTGCQSLKLLAAKNGTAAFQLLLKDAPGGRLTVKASSALPWDLFLEVPVCCPHNTGSHGFTVEDRGDGWEVAREYSTREAPFLVYDALRVLPEAGLPVEKGTNALYVSVTLPEGVGPGLYPVSFAVDCGGEAFTLSGTLEVTEAAVAGETLTITNWYSLENMAVWHHVEPWSQGHWAFIEEYGRWMRRARQNAFWVGPEAAIITKNEDGTWAIDFSRAKRLIELYLGMGFTVIEGAPLFTRDDWDSVEMKIAGVPALSKEGYTMAITYLKAWHDFLAENGWLGRLIQHVGDEPHEGCADAYRILSGILRKYLPGVPLMDAVEITELYGAVDIWVPKDDFFEKNRDAFEEHRAAGDTIWFYTCCKPGGHYANRLLDMPLIRSRMLHWGNYVYDLPGFLHWGLNQMRPGYDPFMETCPNHGGVNHFLPSGDSHAVYPSPDGSEVYGSLRLEQMKGGAEEYELLQALAARDKAAADDIAGMCFTRFDDCDASDDGFAAAREKLLRS